MLKRQKERARVEHREEKAAAKLVRQQEQRARREQALLNGEDPDLVGLVCGPQPTLD